MISGLAQPDATGLGLGGQHGSGQKDRRGGNEHSKLTHVSSPWNRRAYIVGYLAQHIIQNCQINSGTAWKVPSKIAHSELAVAMLRLGIELVRMTAFDAVDGSSTGT
jgi:hypothetical protein